MKEREREGEGREIQILLIHRGGGLRGGTAITSNGQQSRCALTLVSGPLGVGKRTVIRAVARQCRLHVIEVREEK